MISLGSPHVLRAHMGHTCGGPSGIELTPIVTSPPPTTPRSSCTAPRSGLVSGSAPSCLAPPRAASARALVPAKLQGCKGVHRSTCALDTRVWRQPRATLQLSTPRPHCTATTTTTNHKPQTTNHKPQITIHNSRFTTTTTTTNHNHNHTPQPQPQTTNHKPRTTNHNSQPQPQFTTTTATTNLLFRHVVRVPSFFGRVSELSAEHRSTIRIISQSPRFPVELAKHASYEPGAAEMRTFFWFGCVLLIGRPTGHLHSPGWTFDHTFGEADDNEQVATYTFELVCLPARSPVLL